MMTSPTPYGTTRSTIALAIILQSTGRDGKKDISFTCAESEAETALRVLRESAKFDQVP